LNTPRSAGRFEIEATASDTAVRSALSDIRAWLWSRDLPDSVCGDVEIAMAEVLNNVVEHACADHPGARFTVTLSVSDTSLDVVVTDPGKPLPGLSLPPGEAPDQNRPRAHLPEGGFGWFLIRRLTTSLSYERTAKGNRLALVFGLDSPSE